MHIGDLLGSNVYCAAPIASSLTIAAAADSAAASIVGAIIDDVDDVMFMFVVECVAGVDGNVAGKWNSCADIRKMSTRMLTAIVTK